MKETSKEEKKDYSKIDNSKIKILIYDHYDFESELKKIKYPTYPISNAQDLQHKIQSFKDDNVRTLLKKELTDLNSYRKIRGDGNCFFRAIAFYCLSLASDTSLLSCFPQIKNICLTCCYPESIPKQFQKFYEHNFLIKVFERQWQVVFSKLLKQCQKNSRKALIKMFDMFPYLDFIVILYYRSICLKALWKQQQNLKQFLLGKQQQSIRTYSQQTQGVVINICSIMLNLVINVYQIRKDDIKIYHYDNIVKKQGETHLLFYQNHYDILQKNQQIQAQKNSLSQTNYYSNVSKNKVRGTCLQCDKQRMVYVDSAICQFCFDRIQQAAKRYDGQKLRRGRCQDCYSYRQDILEDLGICKKCVKNQNQIAQKRKKQEERRSRMKKCIQCNHLQEVGQQTGMCKYCSAKQQKYMSQMQAYQQKKKSNDRLRQSPQKQRSSKWKQKQNEDNDKNKNNQKQREPNSDYYDKYRVKQSASPSKRIGEQIKPSKDQSRLRQTQPPERDKTERVQSMMTNSTKLKPETCQKCQHCQRVALLFENTPLCKDCYGKIFTELGFCSKCQARRYLYHKDRRCKDCIFQKAKQNSISQQKTICSNCKKQGVLEQKLNICKQCYRTIFSDYANCQTCGYQNRVNKMYKKCKECYIAAKQKPSVNPVNQRGNSIKKEKCMKCVRYPVSKQSLCQSCYKSSFCTICRKVKLSGLIIQGRCSQCRAKY